MKVASSKHGSARKRVEMPEMPVMFSIGQRGNAEKHVAFRSNVQNAARDFIGELSQEDAKELLRQIICLEPNWIVEVAALVDAHNKREFDNLFHTPQSGTQNARFNVTDTNVEGEEETGFLENLRYDVEAATSRLNEAECKQAAKDHVLGPLRHALDELDKRIAHHESNASGIEDHERQAS